MTSLELTPAEKEMIEAAANGKSADLYTGDPNSDNPVNGVRWGPERTIRAEVIRRLCLEADGRWPVHTKGVRVKGARIDGQLDFESVAIPHPLQLIDCYFENDVILRDAEARRLDFSGSYLRGLQADRLATHGDVSLGKLTVNSGVSLSHANIDGTLDCQGAIFRNSEGYAFNGDGLTTKGHLVLDAVKVEGEVRLIAANIGGNFSCRGGNFNNPQGKAIHADRIKANGCVYLNENFSASGWVRLVGAELSGDLYCGSGTFEAFETRDNRRREALSADHLRTRAGVFLNRGFTAKGEVRLLSMKVGSDLRCEDALFENPGKRAFTAESLEVVGTFRWRNLKKKPQGEVILAHANVGQLDDDLNSWPEHGYLHLDGFIYRGFTSNACTGWKNRREWLKRQNHFRPQPYEQLVKILRETGHDYDARRVAIEKQKAARKSLPWWPPWSLGRRIWSVFLGATVAHGYRPLQALPWMMFFIAMGYFFFNCAYSVGAMNPLTPHPAQFNPFVYSLDAFLPIIDLQQERHWLPTRTQRYCSFDIFGATYEIYVTGLFYYYYKVWHVFAGWVLTTLFVAGLAGLIKKD